MAKLLTLALAETTRQDTGYEIIAKNIDDDSWVIIPALSNEHMFINNKSQWDVLAITEADISPLYGNRSGVYEVLTNQYYPQLIKEPVVNNLEKIEILKKYSNDSIKTINSSKEWVGLLEAPIITDIIFRKKNNEYDVNYKKTFFWECRIDFIDKNNDTWKYGDKQGIACKDKRFKSYWKELMNKRDWEFQEKKEKWLKYIEENVTYLLIEFIPNDYYGNIAMISGIYSIKDIEGENE